MPIINSGTGFFIGRQFDVQLSAELRHKGDPIFERFFDGTDSDIVDINENTFLIPDHFFRTGEELTYEYDGYLDNDNNAVGVATTSIPGVGIGLTRLPTKLYAVALNDRFIQVAGTKERALRRIPDVFDLDQVGFGTFHKFIGEEQNSRSLITVDNVIQTPAIDTEVKTQLLSDLPQGSDLVIVVGLTSFFSGDLIRIGSEIMRIDLLGIGNTTSFIVRRPLLGTGLAEHNAGDDVVKLTGNYQIVDNIIYFPTPPFDKKPTTDLTRKDPEDRDYIGIETFSTFDGRVFLRSGFEDTSVGPYDTNYLLDDISNQFVGISTQAILKEQGLNISGFSTGNALVLINNVFQTPDFIDYGLAESSGITTISFTGSPSANPEDINTSSIPRGGIIVQIGTNEGYGYQPLVAAGGTARVSTAGTIESISLGYTGSGYRAPEEYILPTKITYPTFAPSGSEFFIEDTNGLFKQLEYFLGGTNKAKCRLEVKDSIGVNRLTNSDFADIVSFGNTSVTISSGLDAWTEVSDTSSFQFFASTNVREPSGISTNIIEVASVVGVDTNVTDYYLSLGSVASNVLIEDVDEVNRTFTIETNTSEGYVDNSGVTISTFVSGITNTNVGDTAYIVVTEPNVGVANVYVNTIKDYFVTNAPYTNTTGIVTVTAPGFTVSKGEKIDLRNFIYKCDSGGGVFGSSVINFNERIGISSITTPEVDIFSIYDATYDPTSGISTLSIGIHTISSGENFYIEKDSLGFSCTLDGNATTGYYPRPGDENYGKSYEVLDATATTVVVNVGDAGTNESDHVFERVSDSTLSSALPVTTASYDANSGISTINIVGHGLTTGESFNVSFAEYDPNTGISTLTIGTHSVGLGASVVLSTSSLGFTCDLDGNTSVTYYPRPGDPADDQFLEVLATTATTIEVNVGDGGGDLSAHTFVGVNTETPRPVKISYGDFIFLEEEGLTFTCTLDGNVQSSAYPRESGGDGEPDYAYNRLIEVLEVPDDDNIVVYVGYGQPGEVYDHTFVSATTNAVRSSTGQSRHSLSGIVTVTNDGDVDNTLEVGSLVQIAQTGTELDNTTFTVVNTPETFGSNTNAFTIDVYDSSVPPPRENVLSSSGYFVLATIALPSGNLGFEFEVLELLDDGSFILNVGKAPQDHIYVGGGTVKNITRGLSPVHIGVSSIKDGHLTTIEQTNVGAGFTQYNLYLTTNLILSLPAGTNYLSVGNISGINTYTDFVSFSGVNGSFDLLDIIDIDEDLGRIILSQNLPFNVIDEEVVRVYRYDEFNLDIDEPLSYNNLQLPYSPESPAGIGSYAKADLIVGNDGKIEQFELIRSGYSYGQGEILTIPTGGVTGIPTFVTIQTTGISTSVGILTGSVSTSINDRFGYAVAISDDSSTMMVGSPYDNDPDSESASGVVYIFDRSGDSFSQVGILTGENASDADDEFGFSVAMSADGNRMVVGAPADEGAVGLNTGQVYIYDRNVGPSFDLVGILTSTNISDNAETFGYSVDMTSDGNTIVVGSYNDDSVSANSGAVYIYDRVDGPPISFSLIGTILGTNSGSFDRYGFSVSISPEGDYIAVGAERDEDTANPGDDFGLVYVHKRTGGIFNEVGILTSPAIGSLKGPDQFGYSTAISEDGKIVAVGAVNDESVIGGTRTGQVYLFERILDDDYYLIQVLKGEYSIDVSDNFGESISLSNDGKLLIVGAPNDERSDLPSGSGLAYIYERRTENYLGSDYVNIGIQTGFYSSDVNDNYGVSVDIAGEKGSIIVGSQFDSANEVGIGTSGVVYVNDLTIGDIFDEFQITIDRTFTDSFAGYVFGDLVVFDNISRLFNGKRKEFPIRLNGLQTTLRARPGSTLELEYNLIVFINDIYQVPNQSYIFEGGSIITFTEAPQDGDKCVIVFYYGTTEVDTRLVDILETIKVGDTVQLNSQTLSLQQNPRTVTDIRSTDIIETNVYSIPGLSEDDTLQRPLQWCKQLVDKVIDGEVVGKSRTPYEPEIYPKSQIIKSVGIGSTETIFVESLRTFFDSDDEYEDVGVNKRPQKQIKLYSNEESFAGSASIQINSDLRVSNIVLEESGLYYPEAPEVSISAPNFVGVGTTANQQATATSTIDVFGRITSITLTNPGYGYTTEGSEFASGSLYAFVSPPTVKYEIIEDVVYEGDFGWVTGIGTTAGVRDDIDEVGIATGSFASDASDQFGNSIACSSDGSKFIVGAVNDEDSDGGLPSGSGVAYIFTKTGGTLTEIESLTGLNATDADDNFGHAVAMNASGDLVAVSAIRDEYGTGSFNAGVVYVYEDTGSGYQGISTIVGSQSLDQQSFAWSLALDSSGNTLIAGARLAGSPLASGLTYIFNRDETTDQYLETQFISGSTADEINSFFGTSVDTDNSGTIVAVGAPGANNAFIFELSDGNYVETSLLESPESAPVLFGSSIAISPNGSWVVVGDPSFGGGKVYTYKRNVAGTYDYVTSIEGSLVDSGDQFGSSVDISNNGRVVVIGSPSDETETGDSYGTTYVFSKSGNAFTQVGILTGTNANDTGDSFGSDVAISDDGDVIFVGAPSDEDPDSGASSGVVYAFDNPSPNVSEKNLVFELYIQPDSYLRNNLIVPAITESTIQEGYYFRINKSNAGNVGFGITSVDIFTGEQLFLGDTNIDGVYHVSDVVGIRTEVPGLTVGFGRTEIIRVTVPVEDYAGLDILSGGIAGEIGVAQTYGQYFGDFSWGRIDSLKRRIPTTFNFYNNGESGIASSPTVVRLNPLKFEQYTPNIVP